MSDIDDATQQAPGTIIRVSNGSRSTWHHSVSFDGRKHGTACGESVHTDDIETVIMDLQEWETLDGRECCDECAGSVRALVEDWDGLHEKYEVYEDGEGVEDCFVLEPTSDPAARAAVIEYAKETDNEELAQDLRDWIADICKRDHVGPDGSHTDRVERLLLGEEAVTWQCGVAANPEFDEDDPEYCGHEPEEIELDEPAYRDDRGKIYVPGSPHNCPECGNPHEFEFNGVTVVFGV